MRFLTIFILIPLSLFAELNFSASVATFGEGYIHNSDTKDKQRVDIRGDFKTKFINNNEDFEAIVDVEYLYDKSDESRRYIQIDEAKVKYLDEYFDITLGKMILFWGALEVYNIADTFNQSNTLKGSFSSNKLGEVALKADYYFENSEFNTVVKFYNQDLIYPYEKSPFYMPFNVVTPDKKPTYYFKYSGSTDSDYPIDYAFILQYGYDNQLKISYPLYTPTQSYYQSIKLSTYNNIVLDSLLLKFEGSYTRVDDDALSDYIQSGFGGEYKIEDIAFGSSLDLILEYYRYDTNDNTKLSAIDLFRVYQNDIFGGARLSFNNKDDSSFLFGIVGDLEYDEYSISAKFESSFYDDYSIKIEAMQIIPTTSDNYTVYKAIDDFKSISCKVKYHF